MMGMRLEQATLARAKSQTAWQFQKARSEMESGVRDSRGRRWLGEHLWRRQGSRRRNIQVVLFGGGGSARAGTKACVAGRRGRVDCDMTGGSLSSSGAESGAVTKLPQGGIAMLNGVLSTQR